MDRQIDYAPAPPRYRRKAVRRALGLVLLVAVVLPLGWKAGPPALQRVRALYWQRQAMNYTLPPDRVVYDEDTRVNWLANEWANFYYQFFSQQGGLRDATLFLHRLGNANGKARLVAVEKFPDPWPTLAPRLFLVHVCVIRPGSLFEQPTTVIDKLENIGLRWSPAEHVHCYAGQPDPADASHFTLNCLINDRSIVVDGWLQDDDTVKLEPRGFSLTSPAPSSAARSR